MMHTLTHKQARFVDEYLVDFNGAQAAIRAGYSQKAAKETAYKLLTICHISDAVNRGAQEASERLKITRDTVFDGLVEAAEIAKGEGNVMAMVSAWREVAKLLGMYPSNRVQVEPKMTPGKTPAQKQIERMTDEELLAFIDSTNYEHGRRKGNRDCRLFLGYA